jgi:hypothetical protein
LELKARSTLAQTLGRFLGFATLCLLRKPKPGFCHLQEEGLVSWILRILSQPNALARVPAIIVSRRHAAVSPPFGSWRFNSWVPNWFHLLRVSSSTRGSGRLADRTWLEPPVFRCSCSPRSIRVTHRKDNSTNGRSSRYVPEHPPLLAAPCTHARSFFATSPGDSSRSCGVTVRPFVKKAFPVVARVTGVSSAALALRYRGLRTRRHSSDEQATTVALLMSCPPN